MRSAPRRAGTRARFGEAGALPRKARVPAPALRSAAGMKTTLSAEDASALLGRLPAAPGLRPARRQPVHSVYGGAQLFGPGTIRKLGDLALRSLRAWAPDPESLAEALGLPAEVAAAVHPRVVAKLEQEPVEDYRLDFEDGYGIRSDEEEDGHAVAGARAMAAGGLPPWIGLRLRALTARTGARALRTLGLFFDALGEVPPGFLVTIPKVEDDEAPAVLAAALDRLGVDVGVELMVESPAGLDPTALRRRIDACGGRCVAVHLGAYDYLTSCGVGPSDHDLGHPALDHARLTMHLGVAGTGVALADGATLALPIPPSKDDPGARAAVHRAWRLHGIDVRRGLRQGFHQGWDLHPAQMVSRYATVYAYYRQDLDATAARLRNFVEGSARATRLGTGFDDAATGNALLMHLLRGLDSGALDEAEVRERTGLSREDLATRSFAEILRRREA